ncbi:hypothetical protein C8A03DRAFT_12404, partial [Achaetomium macrosporum]
IEMSERDMQSVLRCGRCNKPFDKQSTLKRHGYYCRSRKDEPNPRARSCNFCARRKARCDNKRPACSACMSKGIECHYPANTPRDAGRGPKSVHRRPDRDAPPAQVPETASALVPGSSSHHSFLDDALAISDLAASANTGDAYLGWDDPGIDFTELILPQMDDGAIQFSPALSSTAVRESTPSTVQLQETTIQSPPVSIPTSPFYLIGSFVPRPKSGMSAQRTAKLLLQNLKSYPLMMLRHNTLPPFIHPRLLSDFERSDMEPLHNCMSLLHMIGSRLPGSRKLFWRNVRMECERFCKEYRGWNKWELLAALQALAIYLIIRLDEGQMEHSDVDFLLVAAVTEIAEPLGHTGTMPSDSDSELSWDDWIFEESKRRICVIYQVVDMLVFWEPAALCDIRKTDLLLAPLPARRQLWEARDEATWKAESKREKADARETAFALAANGELVKVHGRQVHCTNGVVRLHKPLDASTPSPWSTANWDEWCSEMDGFGGLVMLASSLTA